MFESYATWCPLQPSMLVDADYYNCTGAGSAAGAVSEDGSSSSCSQALADGTTEPVSCGLVTLCVGQVCECAVQGCAYNRERVGQIFVRLDGRELDANFPDTAFELAGGLLGVRFGRVGSP